MKTRPSASARSTRLTPLFVLCSTLAVSVASWLPSPMRAQAVPQTVVRQMQLDVVSAVSGAPRDAYRVEPGGAVHAVDDVRARPVVLCPAMRFTAFGLTWGQRGTGTLAATVATGGGPSRLGTGVTVAQADGGPDTTSPEYRPGRRASDLLWVGDASCASVAVRLPAGASISAIRAVFINSSGTAGGGQVASSAASTGGSLGAGVAEAMPATPGIIRRSEWGADETLRNCDPSYAERVKMAFVHHTDNANGYSKSESDDLVRAVYAYHTNSLGWCDIAYNFLVDAYGQIFEGRFGGMTKPVISAATMGFNTNSVSVSALGNFQTGRPPSAMVSAIQRVLAWRLDAAHVSPTASVWMKSSGSTGGKYPPGKWVSFRTISGHRDAGYTACPGDNLYALLPAIRTATFGIGLPKIFSPDQSPESIVVGVERTKWTASGSGSVTWQVIARNAEGHEVMTWTRTGASLELYWMGRMANGRFAAPGIYRISIAASDGSRTARGKSFSLTLEAES